jgi:histone-lysine N-methyltransferase SETMAR
MQWKHPSSPSTKKFKVTPSPGKVMLTVFWDSQGVLVAHYQKCGENVNSASYCEVLLKLWDAIRRKCPGHLARGVLLHHDNARPHTARATHERIQELESKLPEHPPYSPDLAPSNFHLFHLPRNHLGGKHFTDDEEAETGAYKWLRQQPSCRFRHTDKAMAQVYQCWWRICREINVFFQSRISHVLRSISIYDLSTDFPSYLRKKL